MECPQCGLTNPPGTPACTSCATPLPAAGGSLTFKPAPSDTNLDSDRTLDTASGWSAPHAVAESTTSTKFLEPGRLLGNRYEIIQLLGEGGMGAVYKARDTELEKFVAIKVIRPELGQDADVLRRFKQEIILARKVTHRNVIRIFDLGEAEGMKFITMEFIDGVDLKAMLKSSGRIEPSRAAEIIKQVCSALEAAHTEGVIHRDLKPHNVMVDAQDKVFVMDFGIARGTEPGSGMTQTGALVGTPEYMSPEQAKGERLDARSDLFSLGIIFYELLTGDSPYKADTAMASLYKRTREPARPPIELNPQIPRVLSDIVVRCLQIDKEKRYASATEVLRDLEGGRATRAGTMPSTQRWPRVGELVLHRKGIAGASIVFVAAAFASIYGAKYGFRGTKQSSAEGPSVSLAILPFGNSSGDQKLDWLGASLADMLSTDVGQSSHLRTISPDRVQQIMRDLQISADSFSDRATVRRVADMSNADTVVWGHYAKFGDQIRVDATLLDIKRDRNVSFKAEGAANQDAFVDQLAQTIRENLSLRKSVVDELRAQAFKPSSTNPEAIRFFSQGAALSRAGKNIEALSQFQQATQADPQFALAYAKLGETFANLGHDAEAEQASRKAVELSENLPAREKYLIVADDARIQHDYPKAIKYYEDLALTSPGDPEIQLDLGRLYEDTGAFDEARAHYSTVLSADPNDVSAVLAAGRLEYLAENSQRALQLFSNALALANRFGNDEAKGTALQGIGLSYRDLGKQDEALGYFDQALAVRRRLGDKRGIAVTLNVMGQIEDGEGKSDEALKAYGEALNIRQEIGDKRGMGDTLIDLGTFYNYRGRYDEAMKYFKQSLEIERDLQNVSNQGLCLNNIGTCYLSKGDFENAMTYFQQALDLRQKSQVPEDTAITLHNLAATSEKMGQYDSAVNYYERALDLYRNANDKRGAATELYALGVLFGDQGRFGAAINSKEDALKSFTELKDRTYWMTEVMSGYGKSLADSGRFDEAQKPLSDALNLARELKIDGSVAQALDFQGESSFYRGDFNAAGHLYDQALQFASRSKEQEKVLKSRFDIARLMLAQGQTEKATTAFREIVHAADGLGMKSLSLEASVSSGEALVKSKNYAGATKVLETAIAGAEKLELRSTLARAHCSLARALRLSGHSADAAEHYRQALRYLDEIRKDVGSDAFLQRSDFKAIDSEAKRYSQPANH